MCLDPATSKPTPPSEPISFWSKVGKFLKELFSPVTDLFKKLFHGKSLTDNTTNSDRDIQISAPTNFKHVDGTASPDIYEKVPPQDGKASSGVLTPENNGTSPALQTLAGEGNSPVPASNNMPAEKPTSSGTADQPAGIGPVIYEPTTTPQEPLPEPKVAIQVNIKKEDKEVSPPATNSTDASPATTVEKGSGTASEVTEDLQSAEEELPQSLIQKIGENVAKIVVGQLNEEPKGPPQNTESIGKEGVTIESPVKPIDVSPISNVLVAPSAPPTPTPSSSVQPEASNTHDDLLNQIRQRVSLKSAADKNLGTESEKKPESDLNNVLTKRRAAINGDGDDEEDDDEDVWNDEASPQTGNVPGTPAESPVNRPASAPVEETGTGKVSTEPAAPRSNSVPLPPGLMDEIRLGKNLRSTKSRVSSDEKKEGTNLPGGEGEKSPKGVGEGTNIGSDSAIWRNLNAGGESVEKTSDNNNDDSEWD